MMRKTYQITEKGKKELEVELADLKSQRGEIADKIAAARDFGDLSENAEYDAAREEQGLVETRIAEIEDILQHASIITGGSKSRVGLGTTVELKADNKKVSYIVVGPVEADPLDGKVSDQSPIGKQLIDKKVGDEVVIITPKATTTYVITALS